MDDDIGLEQMGSQDLVSISGPSQRPDVSRCHNITKRPKVESWLESMEEPAYTPIESLVCTQSCPLISGTLMSVSEWATTRQGTRYSNFVLKDASGQIIGVIYRSQGSCCENQFVTGARLTVANAVVKPVRELYREKAKSKYELSIANTLNTVAVEPPLVENCAEPATRQMDPNVRILISDVVEKIDPRELIFAIIDVMGVIIEVEEIKSKNRGPQNTITRDFRIIDESEMEVTVTIWNERATRFESPVGTVVAIYDVVLRLRSELEIKSLTFQKNSRMVLDPPGDDAERIITNAPWRFSLMCAWGVFP